MTGKRRFTVIENKEYIEDNYKKERMKAYQTNPMNWHSQSLREQFARFANEEAGSRFSVDDLLKW